MSANTFRDGIRVPVAKLQPRLREPECLKRENYAPSLFAKALYFLPFYRRRSVLSALLARLSVAPSA